MHVRKALAQVARQAVNDLGAPTFACLAFKNQTANIPVQQHHRGVGRQNYADALAQDALLDGLECRAVVGGY